MVFQNSSADQFPWIVRTSGYSLNPNVFLEPIRSFAGIDEHIDHALKHSGVWCGNYGDASRIFLQTIGRTIPILNTESDKRPIDEITSHGLTGLRKAAGTPVSFVLVPTSQKRRFVSDDGVQVVPTDALDDEPFNSNEIIALAIPPNKKLFYIEGEYAKLRPLWRQHVLRIQYQFTGR